MAAANSVNLDILYAYDGLNRVTAYDRGDINGGHSAITTLAFGQDWTLDQLNNWSGFNEDTDGNGTDNLVQGRTLNDANEITAITATTGANWVDPTYDGAGNMITGPTPGAETTTQKYVYDAWNRLVKVTDGSDVTVLTYGYDARSFRVTKGVYTSGSLTQTRHYYHSDQNQVLEERLDASSNPNRQYTWGSRYIDDLVLRTRDTDANGSLDETLYALQDANWSITALADTSGTVLERFRYDAYGKPLVLDANFAADADGVSDYAWEYRFTSREWDVESKLHYFRARYYDDAGGRFLQRDPIGYVDGMNLYAGYFVPSLIDPSGLKAKKRFPKPQLPPWWKICWWAIKRACTGPAPPPVGGNPPAAPPQRMPVPNPDDCKKSGNGGLDWKIIAPPKDDDWTSLEVDLCFLSCSVCNKRDYPACKDCCDECERYTKGGETITHDKCCGYCRGGGIPDE